MTSGRSAWMLEGFLRLVAKYGYWQAEIELRERDSGLLAVRIIEVVDYWFIVCGHSGGKVQTQCSC